VLLVDDEPQVLIALEDLLSDEFIVLKSPSPEAALTIAETEDDIAVIISDERMPKLRGSELFARIREASDARRILVTGFADLAAVVRAVNDGKIFAYVTKPWDGSDLKQKVHEAADQYRLVKEVTSEHQLLRDLMDNTPDGICFKDRQLRIRGANRSFAALLGVPADSELVGRLVEEVNPETPHLAASRAQEFAILKTGESVVDDIKDVSEGARQRWVSESKAPVRGTNGEIAGIVGITRDVTERVLMNQTLQESEARLTQQSRLLNAILNSMREAVIASDKSGRFILFNRQAHLMFGPLSSGVSAVDWARAQLLAGGQTSVDVADNPLVRAIRGERVDEAELNLGTLAANAGVFAVTGTELLDERAQPVGGLALIRDVTAHRSLERQLAQAQKMEAIGRLAGGMAHDFNNVLSVIVSYANFVKQGLVEGSDVYNDIDQVLAAVDRAAQLTRQLLSISKSRAASYRPLQLNEIVESLQKMLTRVIGDDIAVETSLAPSLALVKADPSQLEQVLLNLAVNARDAMPEGGTLTFRTSNVKLGPAHSSGLGAGSYVMLEVSDTGTGMEPNVLKQVFEPFFTTKDVGKGTGLGLASVYGIVRQSGGHVDLQSEVGSGTCFRILLPATDDVAAEPRAPRSSTAPPPPLTSINVLLVEDDDAVRKVTSRILRARGYHVLEARSPSEALAIHEGTTDTIHLLLTDLTLPEVSGLALARRLAPSNPAMRVLFMSGYSEQNVPEGGEFAEVAYLEKPFSPYSLAEKVSEIFG